MINNKPAAWELWLKRVDTDWKRYAIYETKSQVERALDRIKGPPLVCKIVPLYRQADWDDDDERAVL